MSVRLSEFQLSGTEKRAVLKPDFLEHLVLVILLNTKIAHGDPKGGMVINRHQKRRLHALLPRMITEGLSEGMAAYMLL